MPLLKTQMSYTHIMDIRPLYHCDFLINRFCGHDTFVLQAIELRTTREESAGCKTEGYRRQSVCDEEHEKNSRRHIIDHCSILPGAHHKEHCFNGNRDTDEDEIFDEPRQPV